MLFGDPSTRLNALELRVASQLARQNEMANVVMLDDRKGKTGIFFDEPREGRLPEELAQFRGGVLLPVDLLHQKYFSNREELRTFVKVPDLLYAVKDRGGNIIFTPLDIKSGLDAQGSVISAAQVSGRNAATLAERSAVVRKLVQAAVTRLGGGAIKFRDGYLLTAQYQQKNGQFSAYLKEAMREQAHASLQVDPIGIRALTNGDAKGADQNAVMIAALPDGHYFATPFWRSSEFKVWGQRMRNQTLQRGMLYPTPVTVVRRFNDEGAPMVSFAYDPQKGITHSWDFRLDSISESIARLKRHDGLEDTIERTVTAIDEEQAQTLQRITRLSQEREAIRKKIEEVKGTRKEALETLARRLGHILARNGLAVSRGYATPLFDDILVATTVRAARRCLRTPQLTPEFTHKELHDALLAAAESPGAPMTAASEHVDAFLAERYGDDAAQFAKELNEQKNTDEYRVTRAFARQLRRTIYQPQEAARKAHALLMEDGKRHLEDITRLQDRKGHPMLRARAAARLKIFAKPRAEPAYSVEDTEKRMLECRDEVTKLLENIDKYRALFATMSPAKAFRYLPRSVREYARTMLDVFEEGEHSSGQNIITFLRTAGNPERLMDRLAWDAHMILRAMRSYDTLARRTDERYTQWIDDYSKIERNLQTKTEQAVKYDAQLSARLSEISRIREAVVTDSFDAKHTERANAVIDMARFKEIQKLHLKALKDEYDRRVGNIRSREQQFNKAHRRVLGHAEYEVLPGPIREYVLDLKPNDPHLYFLKIIPVITLPNASK